MSEVVEKLEKKFLRSRGASHGRKDEHTSCEATVRWWIQAIADELERESRKTGIPKGARNYGMRLSARWLREQAGER